MITLWIKCLLRAQESPGLEDTLVSGFFSKILKGDIISGVKCQGTVYQIT